MADFRVMNEKIQDESSILYTINKGMLGGEKKKRLDPFPKDAATDLKWHLMSKAGIFDQQNKSL